MFLIRWFLLPMIRPVLDNMREAEVWLEQETDDINYTVVRPATLTNGRVTEKKFAVEEDFHVSRKLRLQRYPHNCKIKLWKINFIPFET